MMRSKGKSEKDKDRKESILRAFTDNLRSLSEVTHAAVDRYLSGIGGSAGNKKKRLGSKKSFLGSHFTLGTDLQRAFLAKGCLSRDRLTR
ncbi:hypothetical protein FRUB_05288 [Fimbriiglobus ruber]|uniref:Uncharacterized protein n=1 Tax=Fimbriiglobus ruber TaxID=1908690 RepID=A0A225DT65_9BACT|nr:hypothetical protein FRUB_05288 [Fimbriiglobus ruber]